MVLAVSVMRWASVVRQIRLSFCGSGRMVWLGIGNLKDKRTQVTRQDAKLPHQKLGRTTEPGQVQSTNHSKSSFRRVPLLRSASIT
jgi:hypothetical protein